MANMHFKADLLPNSDYGYSLGSINPTNSELTKRWIVPGSTVETIIGTQTANTGSWTGVSKTISALYDGLTIRYFLPYSPSGNATLNLTLKDGTTTGAINCYYSESRLTTHYGRGCVITLTYFSAGSISINGTATTDNRWIADANYVDGNDVNVSRITYPRLKTGAVGIGRYSLFMETSDGTYQSLTSTFNSTGTSHVKNTAKFKLGRIYYRNRGDDLAANNTSNGDNSWVDQQTSLVDLRYSTNCGTTLTARKPVYIVGTIGTDGYLTLADTWYSQTEPTTEDGKVYIYLGMVYPDTNPYRVALEIDKPVYWYKNGGFRLYGSGRGISGVTRSGTTFTVTRDDGSTFTFTQQDNNGLNWGQITQSGANNLDEGTSDFTDNTEIFSSYASNNGFADSNATGKVYRRDAVHMYNYVKTKLAVTNNNINLSRNTETTIATIGGTAIKIKLPASDNTDAKVAQTNQTGSADYRILLSGQANDTTATEGANKSTNLRFNPSTKILSVGGDISATGDLTITGETNLNGEVYTSSLTADDLLVNGAANFVNIPTSPTPEATSNDTSIATTAFVMNAFTANDAMVFKGVINANSGLPADHKQGWTYRIGTAGTYANKVCEVGDIIICVTDGTAANNDHWAVIQNNIDGAVYRGTNAFTDANIIIADSTAGKVKSSGKTLTTTAPSSSSADTTIPTSKAVWSAISGASGYGKTGTVTSITPGNGLLNGTGTTAITTSGTLNLNYGSSATAVATTAAAGTANTVSRSDHVHSISIVNNNINLSRNTETTIATIAGTAIKIKLPASDNTDSLVAQTNQTTAGDYRVLLSYSANDTTETKGANKSTNLRFNPSTQLLSVGGSISATGDLTITGNANLNGQTYAESVTAGSLLVNGGANFVQIPTAPTPASTSNDTSVATTAFVKNATSSFVTSSGVTSITIQTTSPVTGGSSTATTSTGSYTIALANNYGDTKNPYASKTAKYVLAAPNGSNGAPTFRQLVLSDISGVDDLSAIEALTGTSGLLKKTAANTWTLDTSSYVTSSGVTSITPGNGLLNGTGTTAITSTGTLNLNYGTSASAVATTAAAGTANTVSRSDHVHSISVVNNNINLSRNTETTIATIAGTAIKIKLPASDNTDAKVKQSASTTANWRKVLLHYKDDAASTTAVTDSTNQVYATVGISVQPSTNTLRAAAFNVLDKVTLQFNTITNALDFIFA